MIPNLPTDNLYKFMFIGGLTLIVTVLITNNNKLQEYKRQANQLELSMARSLMYIESETSKLETVWKIDSMKKANLLLLDSTETQNKGRAAMATLENLMVQKAEVQHKLDSTQQEITITSNQLKKELDGSTSYPIVIWIGLLIGMLLMAVGGLCWFNLVQKPMDIRTSIELKMLKAEFNSKNKLAVEPQVESSSD